MVSIHQIEKWSKCVFKYQINEAHEEEKLEKCSLTCETFLRLCSDYMQAVVVI